MNKSFFLSKNIIAFVVLIIVGAVAMAFQAKFLAFLAGFFYIALLLLDSQKNAKIEVDEANLS